MKDEIAEIINHGLAQDLYKAESSIHLYKRIGKYSDIINASKINIKQIMVLLQRYAKNDAILSLSRIYDTQDRTYKNRCMQRLLKILKKADDSCPEVIEICNTQLQLKHFQMPEMIERYLLERNFKEFSHYLGLFLEQDFIQPEIQDGVKKLKKVRDKVLAHSEIQNSLHSDVKIINTGQYIANKKSGKFGTCNYNYQ